MLYPILILLSRLQSDIKGALSIPNQSGFPHHSSYISKSAMHFLSTLLLALLATSFAAISLAANPPVRTIVSQINNDITSIGRTLTFVDGYIKSFDSSNTTSLETKNIYSFLFEILDDTQNAYTSVHLHNLTDDQRDFTGPEAQLLSGTTDGLVSAFTGIYSGLVEKKDQLKAVGLNCSPENLVTEYRSILVPTRTSTGQLYDLITLLSPKPTKQHFTDLSKTFASELDTAVNAYTE
ncbi:hypothetical protein CPB83DRAFT_854557 [Crepidotus variabilis]|uniref:Uncharacterized protein n=1 Tax=Crepidotus variabilis TaxID=179855 RepID=A0A9P6JQA8_9AGAR|nr:hypothetical protein CPB83DRAFT_854557 [Crepidotus variabilis]